MRHIAWLILLMVGCPLALAVEAAPSEKRWYIGIGASNYRPKLTAFERRIDTEISEPLRAILPGWQRPETFRDWSDDSRIWDFWLEGGRDLSPRTSWFLSAGGTAATIRDRRTYFPVGIPLTTTVGFRGTKLSLLGGFVFYPLGKPALDHRSRTWNVVKRAVLRAKPYGQIGVGYTYIRAEGSTQLGLPLLERLYKHKVVLDHHLIQVAPRIGVAFPLNDHDTVALEGGYRFFHEHGAEFDSPTLSVVFRHRF